MADVDIGMEELFLVFQVRDFRINRDHRFGKLIIGRQIVDEAVVADDHLTAGPGFIPAVAVAAKQDRGAVDVIEKVVFAQHPARRAEQGPTRPVVTDRIIAKNHLRRPRQVFHAVGAVFFRHFRQVPVESDSKDLGPGASGRVRRPNGLDPARRVERVHGLRTDKLHGVAGASPFESQQSGCMYAARTVRASRRSRMRK